VWDLLAAAEALVGAFVVDFLAAVGMKGRDRVERINKMGEGQEEAQRAFVHPRTREPVTWRREMRTDAILPRSVHKMSRAMQGIKGREMCPREPRKSVRKI